MSKLCAHSFCACSIQLRFSKGKVWLLRHGCDTSAGADVGGELNAHVRYTVAGFNLCDMAATPLQVLMWVVRFSVREFHRYLKCCYELEQPRLVQPWLVGGGGVL